MTDHRIEALGMMCLNRVLLSGSVMMAEMVVVVVPFVDNSCSARLKYCCTWTQCNGVCIQLVIVTPLHSLISHLYE